MFCNEIMNAMESGAYDEALERYHETGPELDGWLSNHGPMVVHVLARRGGDSVIHSWTDQYVRRLEPMPGMTGPIDTQAPERALGDPSLGDWIAFFESLVTPCNWNDVLVQWWPILLPGIAAGATHGVIRVGHATEALRQETTEPRARELAQALGYWACRWQRSPCLSPRGSGQASDLVRSVPRVPTHEGGIRSRLTQLAVTPGWLHHAESLRPPAAEDEVEPALLAVVDAVVLSYPQLAHGNPTMLVHAATAPHAVARALPSLPARLWRPSFDAAWSASCAVLAAYSPGKPATSARPAIADPNEALELAVKHRGEHVIKFADTALDVFHRTDDTRALSGIATAISLDA